MSAVAVTLPTCPTGLDHHHRLMGDDAEHHAGRSGGSGYGWAKNTLMSYTGNRAARGPRFIRVNCIHPTNVNTHLLLNDRIYQAFCPEIENPTLEDAELRFTCSKARSRSSTPAPTPATPASTMSPPVRSAS